jgi:plastocyanin
MKTALWVTLSIAVVAFAGCTDDPVILTNDDCLVDGLILDPAVEQTDNETGETFIGPACVEDIPSVTVEMIGAPDTVEAWNPISLTWKLHTTLDADHSHNNGIRVNTESEPSYQGKVAGYGTGLLNGKEEHRNFVEGDFSLVTWTPEAPGTYFVRAYAVSAWGNYWAPEMEVTVTEVAATGEGISIAIQGGGLPSASTVDQESVDIMLGDTVTWTTEDPGVSWTIARKSGPDSAERFSVTTDEAVLFQVPGVYTYTATASSPGGESPGSVDGTINVAFRE